MLMSPLKKKDLMEDYGNNDVIGGGSLKEQECETDEEEGGDLNKIKATSSNSFTRL